MREGRRRRERGGRISIIFQKRRAVIFGKRLLHLSGGTVPMARATSSVGDKRRAGAFDSALELHSRAAEMLTRKCIFVWGGLSSPEHPQILFYFPFGCGRLWRTLQRLCILHLHVWAKDRELHVNRILKLYTYSNCMQRK